MFEKLKDWWATHPVVRDSILAGVAVVAGYLASEKGDQPLEVVALVYMFARAAIGYFLAARAV